MYFEGYKICRSKMLGKNSTKSKYGSIQQCSQCLPSLNAFSLGLVALCSPQNLTISWPLYVYLLFHFPPTILLTTDVPGLGLCPSPSLPRALQRKLPFLCCELTSLNLWFMFSSRHQPCRATFPLDVYVSRLHRPWILNLTSLSFIVPHHSHLYPLTAPFFQQPKFSIL